MTDTAPTDIAQIENALTHALKQSSFWAERAAELSEALLVQSVAALTAALDGTDRAAVRMLAGLTDAEIDDLGGLTEETP